MVTQRNAQIFYSCDRRDEEAGGARCRRPAALQDGRCEDHQGDGFQPASTPTRALVKLTIPADIPPSELVDLAVGNNRNYQASWSNQASGRGQVVAGAESRGLDPFAYRKGTPDEGTLLVFISSDPRDLKTYQPPIVTIPHVLDELYQHMGMSSIRGWKKKEKGGKNQEVFLLQIEFSARDAGESLPDEYLRFDEEIGDLLIGKLYRTYIYENPPRPDTRVEGAEYVLCTVNANYVRDQSKRSHGALHFTKERRWVVVE